MNLAFNATENKAEGLKWPHYGHMHFFFRFQNAAIERLEHLRIYKLHSIQERRDGINDAMT